MAAKSTTLDGAILDLLLNGVALAGMFQNNVTNPKTILYVALHTADPGVAGNQNTNEVAYTGYARAAVSRTSSFWTIAGGVASPTATINFPARSDVGSTVATYASIGIASSGAFLILYSGALTPSITITQGVTPAIAATSSITEA